MSMNVPSGADEGEAKAMSDINTTPLVDVMLVLLIIFLITIPVITKTVPVELPKATNIATQTKPENITIAIDRWAVRFAIFRACHAWISPAWTRSHNLGSRCRTVNASDIQDRAEAVEVPYGPINPSGANSATGGVPTGPILTSRSTSTPPSR